jgi:hypothetical protein
LDNSTSTLSSIQTLVGNSRERKNMRRQRRRRKRRGRRRRRGNARTTQMPSEDTACDTKVSNQCAFPATAESHSPSWQASSGTLFLTVRQ